MGCTGLRHLQKSRGKQQAEHSSSYMIALPLADFTSSRQSADIPKAQSLPHVGRRLPQQQGRLWESPSK